MKVAVSKGQLLFLYEQLPDRPEPITAKTLPQGLTAELKYGIGFQIVL